MKHSRQHRTVPLSGIAASIAGGHTTPSAIVEDCLTRIQRSESSVLAWKFVDPHIRRHAALLDDSGPVGPLHGIPIGVKDVFDTSDMPTTYGSSFYEGHQPASDAAAVSILRDAGALIVGKTVTTEFASVAPPVTRNPRNLDHTPGGSSSGSAAAVAADMVPVALGTQTAGSVIRPAAYCGVVGYKPTFGLVDRTGVKTLAQSFDTVGVFSRNVSDVALVTSVLANRPTLRNLSTPANLRFGLFLPPWLHLGQPCAGDIVLHTGALLRNAGYSVAAVSQIKGFDILLGAQEAVMDWDMRHALFLNLSTVATSYIRLRNKRLQ
ncbi:MAG: amidase [Pararhizobium sp.]